MAAADDCLKCIWLVAPWMERQSRCGSEQRWREITNVRVMRTFLEERLSSAALPPLNDFDVQMLSSVGGRVLGVAIVSEVKPHEGLRCHTSLEHRFQRRYLGCKTSLVYIRVEHVLAMQAIFFDAQDLPLACSATLRLDGSSPKKKSFFLSDLCVAECMSKPAVDYTQPANPIDYATVEDWLHRFPGRVCNPHLALIVHPIICSLLIRGRWRTIAHQPRFEDLKSPIFAHLDEEWLRRANRIPAPDVGDAGDHATNTLLSAQRFQAMADQLREWAPILLQHSVQANHGDDDPLRDPAAQPQRGQDAHLESVLEGHIAWMQHLADVCSPLVDNTVASRGYRGWKYRVDKLVQILVMTGSLRSSSRLLEAVELSVRMIFPPNVAAEVLTAFSSASVKVPSAACMSRYRFYVDVAYMLWQRQNSARSEGVSGVPPPGSVATSRYMSVDASPYHGWDWLLVKMTIIHGEDIVVCF